MGTHNTYRQRYDSTVVELWDPQTRRWTVTEPMSKARGEYVAVSLRDGRALVAGGINDEGASYSSAYVFDPRTERWQKVGLMGSARAGAAGAVLRDGRVLVVGGGYYTGFEGAVAPGAILAAFRGPSPEAGPPGGARLANVEPGRIGYALATAELFDPATGTWSRTGPMRFARVGASAATLGDGRVLVWGGGSITSDQVSRTGEIYDPATGRFTMARPLPPVDTSSLEALGVPIPASSLELGFTGNPVSLSNGDALIVDSTWSGYPMTVHRMFRFVTATSSWVEVGQPYVEQAESSDGAGDGRTWGIEHPDGIVAPLADGTVLFAGTNAAGDEVAGLLDPADGTWIEQPGMPAERRWPTAVLLADGSVLIVGGSRTPDDPAIDDTELLADALRFVPGG